MAFAFQIVPLAGFHSPEKREQPGETQKQGDRYEKEKDRHFVSLAALRDTVIEDADIARAAISGVANPARAIGTAIRL